MRKIDTHDGIEKAIKLAYKEEKYELSGTLQEIVNRYKFIHDQRMIFLRMPKVELYEVRTKCVKELVKEFNISVKQAYLDYAQAEKILDGAPSFRKKELAYDRQLEEIDEDMMMARERKDLKSLAALHKVKAQLNKEYPSANIIDWMSVKFPEIRAVFDPTLINSKVIESATELEEINIRLKNKYAAKSASNFLNNFAKDVEFIESPS